MDRYTFNIPDDDEVLKDAVANVERHLMPRLPRKSMSALIALLFLDRDAGIRDRKNDHATMRQVIAVSREQGEVIGRLVTLLAKYADCDDPPVISVTELAEIFANEK